ncbi:hypothetical protein ANANG_G00203110 [Anguilla anguilla]|uniref:Golgi apparatus protein 1 n=1 Tax=Anguilla anguilla TaxID=7936 RepID=A0A9D3LY99_ANGAN|nr:hypothetical protein ANANG_G00203110 [Anguilla anguilla]
MAACRRVQLLLLLMSVSIYVCRVRGAKSQGNGNLNVNVPSNNGVPQFPGAMAPAGNPVQAAGASQPRRATGWKLAEEEACREDLTRLCPKHTWNNNLAVLECLQDKKEDSEIASDCNHLLWNYKYNLTTDPKFESVAVEVCKSTITEVSRAGPDRAAAP